MRVPSTFAAKPWMWSWSSAYADAFVEHVTPSAAKPWMWSWRYAYADALVEHVTPSAAKPWMWSWRYAYADALVEHVTPSAAKPWMWSWSQGSLSCPGSNSTSTLRTAVGSEDSEKQAHGINEP